MSKHQSLSKKISDISHYFPQKLRLLPWKTLTIKRRIFNTNLNIYQYIAFQIGYFSGFIFGIKNKHTYFRGGIFIEDTSNYSWTKNYHSVAGSPQKSHQWLGFPCWTEILQLCFCTKPELFVSALASILGHLNMKIDSFHSTHSEAKTICIVSLHKRVIPSPLLWIRTWEWRKKKCCCDLQKPYLK